MPNSASSQTAQVPAGVPGGGSSYQFNAPQPSFSVPGPSQAGPTLASNFGSTSTPPTTGTPQITPYPNPPASLPPGAGPTQQPAQGKLPGGNNADLIAAAIADANKPTQVHGQGGQASAQSGAAQAAQNAQNLQTLAQIISMGAG